VLLIDSGDSDLSQTTNGGKMIDLTTEFGRSVEQRLKDEEVIWLTTVTPHGVPQPNPVWFYWDGEVILVYSQPRSYRIRNLKQNPFVSLNLQGVDALGNDVVVVIGEASMKFGYQTVDPGYESKYDKYLPELNMTLDQMALEYSVEITIRPIRLRGS
jgi:PPOX class probable F420-dependent enzyme